MNNHLLNIIRNGTGSGHPIEPRLPSLFEPVRQQRPISFPVAGSPIDMETTEAEERDSPSVDTSVSGKGRMAHVPDEAAPSLPATDRDFSLHIDETIVRNDAGGVPHAGAEVSHRNSVMSPAVPAGSGWDGISGPEKELQAGNDGLSSPLPVIPAPGATAGDHEGKSVRIIGSTSPSKNPQREKRSPPDEQDGFPERENRSDAPEGTEKFVPREERPHAKVLQSIMGAASSRSMTREPAISPVSSKNVSQHGMTGIDAQEPVIHITIGRIDVRAVPQPLPIRKEQKSTMMGLDEYLKQRNERKR